MLAGRKRIRGRSRENSRAEPRRGEEMVMFKVSAFVICLLVSSAFCQTASKYQVATIMDVKTHQAAGSSDSAAVSYDVSLKVGDTIYLVLYTPPLGMNTVKYAAGRELLVLVGKKTITYNDMLGQSTDVPIVGQKPAPEAKRPR
jgi:hypothetical protein